MGFSQANLVPEEIVHIHITKPVMEQAGIKLILLRALSGGLQKRNCNKFLHRTSHDSRHQQPDVAVRPVTEAFCRHCYCSASQRRTVSGGPGSAARTCRTAPPSQNTHPGQRTSDEQETEVDVQNHNTTLDMQLNSDEVGFGPGDLL